MSLDPLSRCELPCGRPALVDPVLNRIAAGRLACKTRAASKLVALAWMASLFGCVAFAQNNAPQVDTGASTQALKKLPRQAGQRVAVSIYEFRSSVGEIAARGSTDMFKTALVQSGQFRVVERARLTEGVVREKQLNAQGLTTGKTAAERLTGARYIFEGSITEATAGQNQRSGGFSLAGLDVSGSSNSDVISLDIRIVDVSSGDIADVVTVRKTIVSDATEASGLGAAVAQVLARKGRNTDLVPNAHFQQQRQESLDAALRAAIDQAVASLATRFSP